jgi:hypothetical protein
MRNRSNSYRGSSPATGTFAPVFIKSEEMQKPSPVSGIKGENDFSGKRYVWLKDPNTAFVKGWVVEELEDGMLRIQCDDGSVSTIRLSQHFTNVYSNEMFIKMTLTKSILLNSTKLTIWRN